LNEEDISHPDTDFFVWTNGPKGRSLSRSGAVLKDGPQIVKTVEYGLYGSADKPKRQLQFHRFPKASGGDAEEDAAAKRTAAWSCENDELDKLLAFLHSNVARSGRYQVVDREAPEAALMALLGTVAIDARQVVEALTAHADVQRIVALLAGSSDRGLSAAQSAVLSQRRALVHRLRDLTDDPAATETDIQALIGNAYWIFGGRYVGVASRRNLTMLDQHDIPLLRSDGTLHVVELKGPSIEKLIVRHRNHWIVGQAVHEAAAQATNYLRDLDEQGLMAAGVLANELGQQYDMSRCFATVVVGHADHHRPADAERKVVARTLRQYSASLSRVEVISYDQLVESAERALDFETDTNRAATSPKSSAGLATRRDGSFGLRPSSELDGCRSTATASLPWSDDEPPF
jgi:hypothetical protein